MSTETETSKNPLQREGTAQEHRFPKALDTLFAKLDDRDLFDYLDFVYKYSALISYVPHEGLSAGTNDEDLDWQTFFSCGVILLSHISKNSSVEANRILKADLYDLEEFNYKSERAKIATNIQTYFDKLELWHRKFPGSDPFKEVFGKIIEDPIFLQLQSEIIPKIKNATSLQELIDNTLYINSEVIRYFDGLVQEAEKELQTRLASEKFTPHIGLLLAFLKLFENSRDNLNQITGRHLNFYYQEILQIKAKSYVEDQAHVVLQLAKNFSDHELKKGTLFKGGKDANGQELLYELTEDFVVGTDTVEDIRSSFGDTVLIKAAQNSRMLDGVEEPLPEDDPSWSPFKNSNYPLARLGFAISSPILRLRTGVRNITINFNFEKTDDLKEFNKDDFKTYYSTDNKWIPVDLTNAELIESNFIISLNLSAILEPITNYSATDMEDPESFKTDWPILKFIFTEQGQLKRKFLVDNPLDSWTINVDVSEINDAIIQNDNGLQKIEKPFMPFGSTPVDGSQFYVGHPEVFSKKLTSLTLDWQWVDAPDKPQAYYDSYSDSEIIFETTPAILQDKNWSEKSKASLGKEEFVSTLTLSPSSETSFKTEEEFKAFTNDLQHGFLRLKLTSPEMAFGHKKYPKLLQEAVLEAGRIWEADTSLLQNLNAPYTPVWENLKLKYTSSLSSSVNSDKAQMQLFELTEFGHQKTSKHLVNGFDGKGRLYIGLENVKTNGSISLLVQFAEGTADPFSIATSKFGWYFLGRDGWQKFAPEKITVDSTEKLLQSGIVRFALAEAETEHSLMPDGLFWLKLVVFNDPSLYNNFISIQTQATTVKFQNNQNDLTHLKSAVPAGTIAKLKVKDPAIKSVQQPFATFGGSPNEDEDSYLLRVSERLRHKDRAIQIWDYERLILENFPEIYKAKCLNHTGRLCSSPEETTAKYSEISPGDVTVICIPNLKNSAKHNLARPAVKFATLQKVQDFLLKRCSAWVNLEVRNPKYEELNVSFNVKFYPEITNTGFYLTKLKTEIDSFLTPWANDIGRLNLGNRIYKSTIINFVEELSYVDYLTNFDAKLIVDGAQKTFEDEIVPTSSLSLIVPGTDHLVELITE